MSGEAARAARGEPVTRALALAATALMLVVVVASAWLRLAQHGFACAGAAECPGAGAIGAARFMHRLAATGVGLVLLAVTASIARRRPRDPARLGYALAALALVGVLAVVGTRSAEGGAVAPAPGVAFVNVIGGLALLGLTWRLRLDDERTIADSPHTVSVARVALIAAAAWIALDAAAATGLAVAPFDGSPGLWQASAVALGALAVTGGIVAARLLRAGDAPRRLGASIAGLVVAAVAAQAVAARAPGVAVGLAKVVAAALLVCALVAAASMRAARSAASTATA